MPQFTRDDYRRTISDFWRLDLAALLALTAAALATDILPLAVPAQAAEVFVAPTGNDAADGSAEKPLATLQAGVDKLAPGDTLVVRSGTYRETDLPPLNGTTSRERIQVC
jgi:hypothetical protein